MRPKILCASLALMLAAGCATQGDPRAWSIEPVISVRGDARDARAAYHLGRYYQDMGQLDKAETAFQRAIAADEEHADALNALGTLYARRGDLERAVATLERVAGLAPLAAHVHNNLGYALLLAGRNDAAAEALQRAVALDPRNRRAWHNLADAYHRLGEHTQAELADARASGDWSDEALAPAAAGRPRPITPSDTATAPAEPSQPPGPTGPASAPSPDRPTLHEVRLVKVAENVYDLRHGPEPAPAATAGPEAAPAGVTAAPAQAAGVTAIPAQPLVALPLAALPAPQSVGTPSAGEPPAAETRAAPPAPEKSAPAVRYEVANGQGRNGLARRVAGLLQQAGLPWARLTNQRPFAEPASVVQYRQGFRDAAEALAARLSFRPAVAAAPSERLTADVRLLLGHDLAASAACADLELCPRPVMAAANADE